MDKMSNQHKIFFTTEQIQGIKDILKEMNVNEASSEVMFGKEIPHEIVNLWSSGAYYNLTPGLKKTPLESQEKMKSLVSSGNVIYLYRNIRKIKNRISDDALRIYAAFPYYFNRIYNIISKFDQIPAVISLLTYDKFNFISAELNPLDRRLKDYKKKLKQENPNVDVDNMKPDTGLIIYGRELGMIDEALANSLRNATGDYKNYTSLPILLDNYVKGKLTSNIDDILTRKGSQDPNITEDHITSIVNFQNYVRSSFPTNEG